MGMVQDFIIFICYEAASSVLDLKWATSRIAPTLIEFGIFLRYGLDFYLDNPAPAPGLAVVNHHQ